MSDFLPTVDGHEFFPRPRDQLLNYPVEMRWEFTRRHPYYLGLWQEARRYSRESAAATTRSDDIKGLAAKFAMGAIGVQGEPVPPETPFAEIAGEDPRFLCGSLQPITIRAIATMLIGQLSPQCQVILSGILDLAAATACGSNLTNEMRTANRHALLNHLTSHPHPDFDKVTDSPLFFMHLGASQETIKEDANRQARLWKAKKGEVSPKIHTTKLSDYLAVWDQFEGWTGDSYDIKRELTLKQIAAERRKSVSTIYDQYRAAFKAILGWDFTSDIWWKTVGRMKLAELSGSGKESTLWLARRRFSRHQDRLVSTTTLSASLPNDSPVAIVMDDASTSDPTGLHDLVQDIPELIKKGKTDDEIVKELNLTNPLSREMLNYVRTKQVDLQHLLH